MAECLRPLFGGEIQLMWFLTIQTQQMFTGRAEQSCRSTSPSPSSQNNNAGGMRVMADIIPEHSPTNLQRKLYFVFFWQVSFLQFVSKLKTQVLFFPRRVGSLQLLIVVRIKEIIPVQAVQWNLKILQNRREREEFSLGV